VPLGHVSNTLEVALVARNYAVLSNPLGILLSDFGGEGGGEWGAMNWANAEIAPLLRALLQTTDPAQTRTLAQQAMQIIADEVPVIPVLHYTHQSALSSRVQQFRFDPFERNYHLNDMVLAKQERP
jgi:peptide/nickel transport system substrate-binding protein